MYPKFILENCAMFLELLRLTVKRHPTGKGFTWTCRFGVIQRLNGIGQTHQLFIQV